MLLPGRGESVLTWKDKVKPSDMLPMPGHNSRKMVDKNLCNKGKLPLSEDTAFSSLSRNAKILYYYLGVLIQPFLSTFRTEFIEILEMD